MTQPGPKQERVSDHGARTHAVPASEGDLGASEPRRDRRRWTSDEPEPAPDAGLVVVVWVLASLIAEVEVLWWVFAHLYEH